MKERECLEEPDIGGRTKLKLPYKIGWYWLPLPQDLN
jgi:hypothetical protein